MNFTSTSVPVHLVLGICVCYVPYLQISSLPRALSEVQFVWKSSTVNVVPN